MKHWTCLLSALGCTTLALAQSVPPGLSENDFLADMPVVLSVSRLPQRLDETPGAVTILDRDMIRRSGARDVADLLRLVPGFQTSSTVETVAPLASYHGGFDGYSNRMQVLVDGRSAYSAFFIGSVGPGLQTVALPDIERIEVLRGSNSAAYGARAFLGVINIVTRDSADTLGLQGGLAGGENGIRDAQARIGWGQEDASFRLSVDRRADDGLAHSNGHNQIERLNFRADLHTSAADELQLRAGRLSIDAGKGKPANVDDPFRDSHFVTDYAQLDWKRSLNADQDLALNFAHTQEDYDDRFPYSLVPLGVNDSLEISASGRATNDNLSLQHTFRYGKDLRVVWGGELRREQVVSKALYNTDAALITDFTRLFGNAEWHLAPSLLLNAGAMLEHSSDSGDSMAPRLMLNWHVAEGQTLRGGVSRAYRPASNYEKFSNVRYSYAGQLLAVTTLASGRVEPESLQVHELGYLGDFPRWGLNLDVRVFQEQVGGFIRQSRTGGPKDYVNSEDFAIQGVEYQLKWQPWRDAQLILGQAFTDIGSRDPDTQLAAPKQASTLTFFQKLPGGLDFSLMHQDQGLVAPQGAGADHMAFTRTDLRLAKSLRLGVSRGEVALVVQNLGTPYRDFAKDFRFEQRAFLTLRLEN